GPPCPTDWVVLQVPAPALLEGDAVTLRCRARQEESVIDVQFYHEEMNLGWPFMESTLSLPPLQLQHSGRYRCKARLGRWLSPWEEAAPVTVTVHGEHPQSTP
ncbi:FCGR2 protein, partial [Climacteris rufus]|nr:FCGR2 protein [Climacteris rufus]